MFRRWFGIALIVWSSVAALISYLPSANSGSALAAGEQYQFINSTTIQATGGSFANTVQKTVNLTQSGGNYVGNAGEGQGREGGVSFTITISNVQKDTTSGNGGYTATVKVTCSNQGTFGTCPGGTNQGFDQSIHIADPNAAGPNGGNASTAGGGSTSGAECTAGHIIGWLICGLIELIVDSVDFIVQSYLVPFLQEQPLTTTSQINGTTTANPVYTIWSRFRDVASVLFILLFFVVIFGTALGLDNYTVKRVLPRLVAGAILVPLSWYICALLIDVTNVVGQGLVALMSGAVGTPNIDFTTPMSKLFFVGGVVAGALVATTALATVGFGVLITFGLAVLAAVFVVVVRKILIILLVIISPFALMAWILPNTERLYRQWWTLFTRLLLMYPIMMLFIEAGRIFSLTAQSAIATGSIGIFGWRLFFGAGVGAGAVQTGLVPFAQVLGLAAGLLGFTRAFAFATAALGGIQNGVQRARRAADNRFGRNSDLAKGWQENHRRKALIKSEDPNLRGNLLGARRYVNRVRSGTSGFLGTRGTAQQQQERHEALHHATEKQAKIEAHQAEGAALGHESSQDMVAAQTQAQLYANAEQRAGRTAIINSAAAGGASAAGLAVERHNAAVETLTRGEAAKIGAARGVIDGAGLRTAPGPLNVSNADLIRNAQVTEQGTQAEFLGKVRGTTRAVDNIDATLGGAGSAAAAAARMTAAGNAARIKTNEDIGTAFGNARGKVDLEAAAGVEAATAIAGAAALGAIEADATARANRQQRVEVQNVTNESPAQVVQAATVSSRESLSKAANDRAAARDTTTRTSESTADFLRDDYSRAEQAAVDNATARQQRGLAEREDAATRGLTVGGPTVPAGTSTYGAERLRASTEAARRAANADTGKRTGILNDTVGSGIGSDTYRSTATYTESKAQGAKSGEVQGVLAASAAEAARDAAGPVGSTGALQAAAQRSSKAAAITGAAAAGDKTGKEQGVLNAEAIQPATRTNLQIAAEAAANTERETGVKTAAESATTTNALAEGEQAAAVRARQLASLPAGAAVSASQLAAGREALLRDSREKAGFETRDATAAQYATTTSAVEGRAAAVTREQARSGIGAIEAERNIINNAAQVASAKAGKEVATGASTNVGILEERANAIQAEQDAKRALTATDAQLNLAENAAEAARVAGAATARKTIAEERGTREGHQEAIDEQIARTTPAGGSAPSRPDAERALSDTLREDITSDAAHKEVTTAGQASGREQERERAIQKEIDEGRAGAVPPDQRAQARRNLVHNASEESRIEAADSERKKIGSAQGVAGSEATEADDEIKLMGRQELNKELKKAGITPATATLEQKRQVALERVRRRDISNNASNAGNARTGKSNEVRGTVERRQAAVKRELASGNVSSTGTAAEREGRAVRNIERKVAITETKQAADKYDRSLSDALGTADAYEAAVQEQAGTNKPTSAQLAAARDAISDRNVEKGTREAAEKTSTEIGQVREENIAAAEDEATVEAEMTAKATKKGDPAPTREQVQAEMHSRARLAAGEVGARSQATKSGRTEALVQAAQSINRPNETQRRSAAVREQIGAAAGEAAGVLAYGSEVIPRPDFTSTFAGRKGVELEKVIDTSMNAAAALPLSVKGVNIPLKDIQYDDDSVAAVRAEIDTAFTDGDIPRAMAGIDWLSKGTSGAQEMVTDRTNPDSIASRWFGATDNENVDTNDDPATTRSELLKLHPKLKDDILTIYNRAVKNGKDPDVKLQPSVSMDQIGVGTLTSGSHRYKARTVAYITDPDRDTKRDAAGVETTKGRQTREKHQEQMASSIIQGLTNATTSSQFKNSDRDKLWRFILNRDPQGYLLDSSGGRITRVNNTAPTGRPSNAGAELKVFEPGNMSAEPDDTQGSTYDLIAKKQNGQTNPEGLRVIQMLREGHAKEGSAALPAPPP